MEFCVFINKIPFDVDRQFLEVRRKMLVQQFRIVRREWNKSGSDSRQWQEQRTCFIRQYFNAYEMCFRAMAVAVVALSMFIISKMQWFWLKIPFDVDRQCRRKMYDKQFYIVRREWIRKKSCGDSGQWQQQGICFIVQYFNVYEMLLRLFLFWCFSWIEWSHFICKTYI